ncbi:protein kinase [Blastocystis sp. ATCC 50177/Nand II]|uniref:Protein kinase n=1 Tax=Blastocystis sp. subtype 1 (strain ATCC 50177 / NandII) TaxID=478820 RepID=A0A196S510_BLAHN|nr:protein kinase [Blastocystis sp. ATCC 50177/Nand II]
MLKRMMKIALGSEVDKSYVVEEKPIATGGPHYCWRVHNAVRKATHEEVSVFMFKDSYFTPEDKPYKDDFMYLLKQDVKKMTMLRHPYTLKVIEVMPDNPKEIVFVTERVTCSLGNMCNRFNNLPQECIPREIKEKTLSAFEVTCGLIHLCEALIFIHDTAKMVHLDLSPENIWITPDGSWKVAGFGFALSPDMGSTRYLLDCGTVLPARYAAVPDMNYAAPELSTQPGNFTTAADMWSLGCLVWELFSLGQEPDGTTRKLVDVEDGNPLTHAYKVQNLLPIAMDRIPQLLQPNLSALLSVNPARRVTAEAMKNCDYFCRGPVQTMRELEGLLQLDEEQQMGVLKTLLPALEPFPDYLLTSMVLPKLTELAHITDFAPYLLPCLLYIGEKVDAAVFNAKLVPAFVPMITLSSPPELVTTVYALFVGKLPLLLEKGDNAFKSKYLLPALGRCISCGIAQLQAPVLDGMAAIVENCDKKRVKEVLVPKLQKIILEGSATETRVRCIEVLCAMADVFEGGELQSELLNTYKQLLADNRDPAIMAAVTQCYTTLGLKLGMAVMSKNILPKVTYLLAEPALNGAQFEVMLTGIEQMLAAIRQERQEEFRKKAEEQARKEAEEAERAKNAPPLPAKPQSGLPGLPPKPPKPGMGAAGDLLGTAGVGDDMFGGMSSQPADFMSGDMFGGMESSAPELPAKPAKPAKPAASNDMFGGMDSNPAPSNDFGGLNMGGDMFGGMDTKPELPAKPAKPAKPAASSDFGGLSMGGDMFGGMDSKPEPAADFGGMSMGGDMFGGMDSKPAAPAPSSDFGGMNMGGDMFGGMDSKPELPAKPAKPELPTKSAPAPAADFGGMSMGGDMFGGMDSKIAKPEMPAKATPAADFGGMSMGGDMFGGMDNKPAAPAASNDFGGVNMGGDMFGGMDTKPEPAASNDFGGMSMGGDMFGGMDAKPAAPIPTPAPAADFGGVNMGGDMFGGMDNKPELPAKSTPASDFGGMSMGGDMFGGMDNKPELPAKSTPAADFGGMSMGGDMFGGMDSKPAPAASNDFGGMNMGGDMFGGMDNKPAAAPAASNDFGGMSMGGDMFGGMNNKPAAPAPASDFGGMNMGGDMFGGMDSKPTTAPSNDFGGMSMGGDMFSGMF